MSQPAEPAPSWLSQFEELAKESLGWPIQLRDYIFMLQLDFDPDEQIYAIRSLLKQHGKLEEETSQEIHRRQEFAAKCKGLRNEFAVDDCIEMIQYSIYQDAAHSMAAVGMLAPLFETLFAQCFAAVHRQYYKGQAVAGEHARWQASGEQAWDCHFVFSAGGRQKDLVRGIMQLAEATGLSKYLPENIEKVLAALFAYRNKMFHCGLEWPADDRRGFAARITQEGWPAAWFKTSSQGDETWIFYMSSEFIDECLQTFEKVLDAFSELVKKHVAEHPPAR
jgi:hypothetical protein